LLAAGGKFEQAGVVLDKCRVLRQQVAALEHEAVVSPAGIDADWSVAAFSGVCRQPAEGAQARRARLASDSEAALLLQAAALAAAGEQPNWDSAVRQAEKGLATAAAAYGAGSAPAARAAAGLARMLLARAPHPAEADRRVAVLLRGAVAGLSPGHPDSALASCNAAAFELMAHSGSSDGACQPH
jgi:hypothetical protein